MKGYSPEENKRFEEEAKRINEERKRARSEFMIPQKIYHSEASYIQRNRSPGSDNVEPK